MNPFFIEQMAMYSAYHRDPRNRATHFIGIPAIVFAIFIPLHWVPLFTTGDNTVTLAVILWVVTGAFYLWLDRTIGGLRSEEHTYELQSLMRISYAVFCLKKKIHRSKKTRPHIESVTISKTSQKTICI